MLDGDNGNDFSVDHLLREDEMEADEEYQAMQEALDGLAIGDTSKIEELIALKLGVTNVSLESRVERLCDILETNIPHVLEYTKEKEFYDELGSPDELKELIDAFDTRADSIEELLSVYEMMTLDVDTYEAKGWRPVLVDEKAFELLQTLFQNSDDVGPIRLVQDVVEPSWGDEKREIAFLYQSEE